MFQLFGVYRKVASGYMHRPQGYDMATAFGPWPMYILEHSASRPSSHGFAAGAPNLGPCLFLPFEWNWEYGLLF